MTFARVYEKLQQVHQLVALSAKDARAITLTSRERVASMNSQSTSRQGSGEASSVRSRTSSARLPALSTGRLRHLRRAGRL